MPIIAKLASYITAIAKSDSLPEILIKQACVEGLFFQGCFYVIYWLQDRGLMPGLSESNERIDKDETIHTLFGLYMSTIVKSEYRLTDATIHAIFAEAVDVAIEFIAEILPEPLPEINAEMMTEFIQHEADKLLQFIDVAPLFNKVHNSPFMVKRKMLSHTNIFERKAVDYMKTTIISNGTLITEF
jgi:ribonucleotide reductase beta subunit family protein with ferritin-like domain